MFQTLVKKIFMVVADKKGKTNWSYRNILFCWLLELFFLIVCPKGEGYEIFCLIVVWLIFLCLLYFLVFLWSAWINSTHRHRVPVWACGGQNAQAGDGTIWPFLHRQIHSKRKPFWQASVHQLGTWTVVEESDHK